MIARNLYHFARVKKEFGQGVELKSRGGRHTAPHQRVEVRILLQEYQRAELHSRQAGRRIKDDDDGKGIDTFRNGVEHLCQGRLATWTKETTMAHVFLKQPKETVTSAVDPLDLVSGMDDHSESIDNGICEEEGWDAGMPVMGDMFLHDGELIICSNIEQAKMNSSWEYKDGMDGDDLTASIN